MNYFPNTDCKDQWDACGRNKHYCNIPSFKKRFCKKTCGGCKYIQQLSQKHKKNTRIFDPNVEK